MATIIKESQKELNGKILKILAIQESDSKIPYHMGLVKEFGNWRVVVKRFSKISFSELIKKI